MFSTFWRFVFISFSMIFLGVNIAFTFDVVNIVVPTSISADYSNYYFGFSSFIQSFQDYFGDGGGLAGYTRFIMNYGNFIAEIYTKIMEPFKVIGIAFHINSSWDILSMLWAIIAFANNIVTMLILFVYGLMLLIYFIAFAFQIVLFVVAMFGGAFKTPLPSTDWWEYTPPVLAIRERFCATLYVTQTLPPLNLAF